MSKILTVDKLESGMILEENVINHKTGVVLIVKNTVMTKKPY